MKIAVGISMYEEQDLIRSCIHSAKMLDQIFVFDGPVDMSENKSFGPYAKSVGEIPITFYYNGYWKSDADKRTDMLKEIQAWNEDAWILWLDGDEILLYGEYLKDHCNRADRETGTGGTSLRLVEYDGSVAECFGKLIKAISVRKYLLSSWEVELTSGLTIALPNVPICTAGGIPVGDIEGRNDPILAKNRPPLMGEPHLLHRHGLRNPERSAPRLHDKEAEDLQKLVDQE